MRQLFIALVLLCHVVNIASADQADAEVKPGGPRVRPNDSLTARLLREGLARSSTLRRLVTQIEERDVIVYLEMQPRIKRQHSGCVTWMHATSTYRYVRASLNPDLSRDQLIATIAHELRHVLEIAEQPRVADASTLLELYRTIGEQRQPGSLFWDTSTARETGNVVRRELASAQAAETAGASGREVLRHILLVTMPFVAPAVWLAADPDRPATASRAAAMSSGPYPPSCRACRAQSHPTG